MYKIGELSKLCRLPVKTLRFYDSERLLVPDEIDRFTGYRYYSAAKLADCNAIIALKELGFSLDEIKRQLRSSSPAEIVAMLTAKEAELKGSIAEAEARLSRLASIRKNIGMGERKMFNIVIRSADAIRIAAKRRIFADKSDAITEVQRMRAALPKSIVGPRNVIINYETEYRERDFDLCAAVEVTGKLPDGCCYEEKLIEFPGDIASLVCRADELEDAYTALLQRIDVPCQLVGAFYEIYHEDGTVELKAPVCRLSREPKDAVNDSTNLTFTNDPDAIGKWKFIDMVLSEEQFCPGHAKYDMNNKIWLPELYFLPEGKGYWIIDKWTKGCFLTCCDHPQHIYAQKYTIKQIDEKAYMFVLMKYHNIISRGGRPIIHVYEKVSDDEFTRDEIRIHDNIDIPFAPDDKILGRWSVCDLVDTPDEFNPLIRKCPEKGLFVKNAEFLPDGKALRIQDNGTAHLYWTKGFVISKKDQTAAVYEIRNIDGREFLFTEWKSGDYVYGGRKPCWYVFTKK